MKPKRTTSIFWAGNDGAKAGKVEGVKYVHARRGGLVLRAIRAPEPNPRYLPEPKERFLR